MSAGVAQAATSSSTPLGPHELDRLRRRVAEDTSVTAITPGPGRLAALRSAVARAVRADGVVLPPDELAAVVRAATDELAGLGPVERLLRDPEVTDVLVNGPHDVWVERAGRLQPTDVRFRDAAELHDAVLRVITPLGHRLDRARPFVDAHLPDGSRLHALLPPLAPRGPLVTLRTFAPVTRSWADLAAGGAVPADAADLLRAVVAARRAVVVCGRTGTGKTTLLQTLLADVGDDERVLVVEDAPELRPRCPHAVSMETRPANAESAGEVTLRDLVRQALRMRPDRIIVGEVRGVEIVDVLQALATGHEGCMTTLHARAADEALVRLEGMALLAGLPLAAARAQLAVGLDVMVVCGRGPEGQRGVVQIAEVSRPAADGPLAATDLWRRDTWLPERPA